MSDHVPQFFAVQCPDSEREATRHLEFLLSKLDAYAQDFQAAVAMFELAEQELSTLRAQLERGRTPQLNHAAQIRMRWQFIAGRDGAMTIFHFGKTIEAIRSSALRDCLTIRTLIKPQPLRNAESLFRKQWFRNFIQMRHSIAHAGEIHKTAASLRMHSASRFMEQNVMAGRVFRNTYKNNLFSYELSQENLRRLLRARDLVFSVFMPLDPFSRTPIHPPGWSSIPT